NPRVLVDDSAIDHAIVADADGRHIARRLCRAEVEIVSAHNNAISNRRSAPNDAAYANYTPLDMRFRNDAAVRDDRLSEGRAIDLASREEARVGVNWRVRLEEAVFRHQTRQVEIRFVKGTNRPDVLPVSLENVGADVSFADCFRDHMLSEISQISLQ